MDANSIRAELNATEILLGVTGGIAAYKAAALASLFIKNGANVTVVMTEAATRLVGEKTFEALTKRPVATSMWGARLVHPHIDLARGAEIFCVAPATANIMAKAAQGLADDLMSATILAFDGPILMAPAMNTTMWNKPATRRNVRILTEDGIRIAGPASGRLSCGESGEGRMAEPEEILEATAIALRESRLAKGVD